VIAMRNTLRLDLGALPQTVAFDAAGRLVGQHEGIGDAETFRSLAAGTGR
jgi:hypothetical protein